MDGKGKTVKLGEVVRIDSSLVDPRENPFRTMLHVGGANIESRTGKLIDLKTAAEEELQSGKYVFDDSMVLYSKIRPYLKKVAFPRFDGVCSADIYPLSVDGSRLDSEFLFHLLQSHQFTEYAIRGSNRAGMPKVNRAHLFSFEFGLPTVKEQRRIVKYIKACTERLEEIEELCIPIGQEAEFLRLAVLRDIEESLTDTTERRTLGSLIKVASGNFLPSKDMNKDGTFPVYGGNGIAGKHDSFMFRDPVIVIGRVGAKCGCVHTTEPNSWVTDNALYVADQYEKFDQRYLAFMLEGARLRQFARQAAQPVISGKGIYPTEIPFVPIEKQRTLADMIESALIGIDELLRAHAERVEEMSALRESILRKAFAGEL